MNRLITVAATIMLLLPYTVSGQITEQYDTLEASVKTDSRRVVESLGKLSTGLEGVRRGISPLGEGDPIRWAQGLPGVTTGADGTTAFYVQRRKHGQQPHHPRRCARIWIFASAGADYHCPSGCDVRDLAPEGGFDGGSSNFTAGHLAITTRDPSHEKFRMSAALNNFLASVAIETPINEKMSFMLSGRISPLS